MARAARKTWKQAPLGYTAVPRHGHGWPGAGLPPQAQPYQGGLWRAARPGPSHAGRPVRTVANRSHRHRHQARPWLVIAATAAAGVLLHLIPAARALAWTEPVPFMLAARFWLGLGRRHHDRCPAWHRDRPSRLYAAACVTTAAVWLAVVTRFGPLAGPGRLAVLALVVPGIWPLGWLWWQHHQVRPGSRRQPEGPDEVVTAWAENFAAQGRRGYGTWLTGPAEIPAGRRYVVHWLPGAHTPEEVCRHLAAVSSALAPLGILRSQLVLEPVPGETPDEPGPDNVAQLTVLDRRRSPQRQIQEFTGPTLVYDEGLFADGPYPDGEMAMARLYKVDEHGRPMRSASGLFVGATGSGKSRLLEHKALEHLLSGFFLVWFLDGQGGASMPGLLEEVDWPAPRPDEWLRVLKAATRLRLFRQRRMVQRRWGCWYASPEEPFVQIIMDEAHKILAIPQCVALVKTLLQESEKTGIGLDIATQVPLMTELGDESGRPGAHVIRALAKEGNSALFRLDDGWSKNVMMGTREVDPRDLPKRPGMHFLESVSPRMAPVRAIRAADPAAWARRAPKLKLDADEVQACDGGTGDYLRRWDRFTEYDTDQVDEDDINAQLNLILTGQLLSVESGTPAAEGKPTAMSLCMDVLRRHGRIKRAALIDEIRGAGHDYSASAIAQALRALAGTGVITNQGGEHGEWLLVDRERTPEGSPEPVPEPPNVIALPGSHGQQGRRESS